MPVLHVLVRCIYFNVFTIPINIIHHTDPRDVLLKLERTCLSQGLMFISDPYYLTATVNSHILLCTRTMTVIQ